MAKTVAELGTAVKAVAKQINTASSQTKNNVLCSAAEKIIAGAQMLTAENQKDLDAARKNGLKESFIDRLTLTPERIKKMADGILEVSRLEDPCGRTQTGTTRPNGLIINLTKVPLGVVGMIFESRPNVTADAASLCIKSGNACILRGGKEAIHSNTALAGLIREALEENGLPADCVALVEDTSRESSIELMRLKGYIDVIIPRGGAGLIKSVVENATVPVIETGVGNCHIYADEYADLDKAVRITDDAKTKRPSVCNAVETLLVHEKIAEKFLPAVKQLLDKSGVELRGCETTAKILGSSVVPVTEEDYFTEFNDFILAVKVVSSLTEAIQHIEKYSSAHSEAIITENYTVGQEFIRLTDAAAVYVNASTRFTDGNEFGYGAEIGISTQKLHARGPMGLEALTTDKYVVFGNGQTRG